MAERNRSDGGRCLLVGIPGPSCTPEVAQRLRDLGPAGVILFRRNLTSPDATRTLLSDLREVLAPPCILAIDQEGGRVSRIEPWIGLTPTAERLAAAGTDTTYGFARATGRALRALGFNLDFAPVVDLSAPDAPNGIGTRAFGTDPAQVSLHAGEFLRGLRAEGVAGCVKHFPGLGDTRVDSHHELPRVERDRTALELDLRPYRDLAPVAPAVMVGHAHYPALDPAPDRPASCSPAIARDLLRGEIGYGGLAVTDDLEMGAVAPRDVAGRAAVDALAAGCDLLLYCADLDRAERARSAIDSAARSSPALARRLADAIERIDRFARLWPVPEGGARIPSWEVAQAAFERFRSLA